ALFVMRDGSVRFANGAFRRSVRYGDALVALTGINEFPPQGGATLLTPAYGVVRPTSGVKMAMLAPLDAGTALDGRYRVTALVDPSAPFEVRAPMLGFGPAALRTARLPGQDDVVEISSSLDPPLGEIAAAVGGGPFLIANGAPVDDPHAPAPEERDRRFPVSGAAMTPDGVLLLFAVDGRSAAMSIGLTRAQFGALMLGFGATNGMAFDSGGSATLVARELGERRAGVLNAPSDGLERPVADGLFVYSDATPGTARTYALRPRTFAALAGAVVNLDGAVVDEAGNFARSIPGTVRAAREAGQHGQGFPVPGAAPGYVTYRTVARLATLAIAADVANPDAGSVVHFSAHGADLTGEPIETGGVVTWSADRGSISAGGAYRAAEGDATISAAAGGVRATYVLHVGRHEVPLALFAPPAASVWKFITAPRGWPGSVTLMMDAQELRLAYDFTGNERAAYAEANVVLPGAPLGIALDVYGDGSGGLLRVALVNGYGERRALTLAKAVDWLGWRRLALRLPADLNAPVTLSSLYILPAAGTSPHGRGWIAFRKIAVLQGGTR
ncbi:MAG: phosphodiester glycosidase family protein, partial [Candidatus Eremiobacteraeota bacterium]|nr:phosphodiester glycosidase family protein [Candidatus Eremiobacteraeota bacterium]